MALSTQRGKWRSVEVRCIVSALDILLLECTVITAGVHHVIFNASAQNFEKMFEIHLYLVLTNKIGKTSVQ